MHGDELGGELGGTQGPHGVQPPRQPHPLLPTTNSASGISAQTFCVFSPNETLRRHAS